MRTDDTTRRCLEEVEMQLQGELARAYRLQGFAHQAELEGDFAFGVGKTTWVRKHMHRGDLVMDMDYLFEALSFLPHKDKPDELLPFVCEARDAVIQRLLRPSNVGRAFLITTSFGQAMEWLKLLPSARIKVREQYGRGQEAKVVAIPILQVLAREAVLRRVKGGEARPTTRVDYLGGRRYGSL